MLGFLWNGLLLAFINRKQLYQRRFEATDYYLLHAERVSYCILQFIAPCARSPYLCSVSLSLLRSLSPPPSLTLTHSLSLEKCMRINISDNSHSAIILLKCLIKSCIQ